MFNKSKDTFVVLCSGAAARRQVAPLQRVPTDCTRTLYDEVFAQQATDSTEPCYFAALFYLLKKIKGILFICRDQRNEKFFH